MRSSLRIDYIKLQEYTKIHYYSLFTARSELRKVLFLAPPVCVFCFLFVCEILSGTAERICAKFTRKTCLVPRSDEFEGQDRQGQKNCIFSLLGGLRAVYV